MKLLNAIVIALVNAGPVEKTDKAASGISTATFDEYSKNVAKIGCARGVIQVSQVRFLIVSISNIVQNFPLLIMAPKFADKR